VRLLGARRGPLLPNAASQESAHAGAFFTYSGAIVSHLATGYDHAELWLLAPLTVLSLGYGPVRRTPRPARKAAAQAVPGIAGTLSSSWPRAQPWPPWRHPAVNAAVTGDRPHDQPRRRDLLFTIEIPARAATFPG